MRARAGDRERSSRFRMVVERIERGLDVVEPARRVRRVGRERERPQTCP